MHIERFEDLDAWQSARELCREIYALARSTPGAKDFPLRDQILSSAISVMSNIAEGFDSGSDVEVVRFLRYAHRSNGELRSQLDICLDAAHINETTFGALRDKSHSTQSLIGGLIRYLKCSDLRVREESSISTPFLRTLFGPVPNDQPPDLPPS